MTSSTPRILVVEDDPVVGELFNELLPPAGYIVDLVYDAEAALKKLESITYDLIITDKNLPGLSGLDLLKRIHSTYEDLDVILMTAFADMDSMLSAINAGVYDYLVKPFNSLDDVVSTVGRALEKRRILLENRRLIANLQQANQQIETMNHNLELQVQERTHQLVEANFRLEQLSITDDVTGLYNQRFLFSRLDEEYRRARRHHDTLAVTMIDIDFFKQVNDQHDHLFGSRVLKRFGVVLQNGVRDVDFVSRYGGDEFTIILPHTNMQDALLVAERLRANIEDQNLGDPHVPCHVTMSVGVAAIDSNIVDSSRALLRAADKALYLAKSSGRNRVAFLKKPDENQPN
ncbi:MAG: diguanylate cyclase [Deltaproteobacteria bacterium]|nr:diguanylate cyclase [Deltaproteobacteria bacterium]